MPDFLLEIGCEEIPARMIEAASVELGERISKLLERERFSAKAISSLDTPRRLAVLASGIPASQPDVTEQVTGPSASIAFKDGQPTPAAHAFAKKAGVDVAELKTITTAKGEYLAATITKKGRAAAEILSELLPKEINSIYWPKNMYWREKSELFVRPVRWLVAMLDGEVVPLKFDGVSAGKESRGHRILANRSIRISSAGTAYVDALREAHVLGRPEREQQIRKALDAATRTISGARWREDKNLLDAVVNLTEFPSVILGSFDPEFLALPEEVLVTVMRDHQKYFAVEDASGKLSPHFLAVLNTDGDPQGIIRHGHERVLRARFNDARFFWQTDQKQSLLDRTQLLKSVTFQKDLGSYYEKTLRVQRLASWLSETVKQNGMPIRPGVVHKAACMAKADLTTELVKEFTELQGIVGGLYAKAQELDPGLAESTRFAIADAIYDHYKPESTEDDAPRSVEGAVLSVADKADTIAGMFALGLVPTGSKDPFALRRAANGIVKTIHQHNLPFRLTELIHDARDGYEKSPAEKKFEGGLKFDVAVAAFLRERLEFYLKDVCHNTYDVVKAVLAVDADDVVDALLRVDAVKQVSHMPEFQVIGAACKRIRNILRQAEEKGIKVAAEFEYLSESPDEEKKLAAYLQTNGKRIEDYTSKKEYKDALLLLSTVREPLDTFFDKVMVMVDDERIRSNRLALLQTLLKEFSTIADFSEIVTEGKDSKESSK
ncbi:MAG TPA: glycine--tRNA ligase subunit beta [Terriglobales bacterium]|nr:glycine--tRNA ligase subunit beta [Terriglobales bacterium]